MTALRLDGTAEPRAGEELPLDALRTYLEREVPHLRGDVVVEQFPKGHSNLTYLLKVGDTELVLRRPPFGAQIKTGHDMGREHRVLTGLSRVYDRAPKPVTFCEDESVMGAPFYIMERKRGVILRQGAKVAHGLDRTLMASLSRALFSNLVEIHRVDLEQAGLTDLGRPEGYVERQVSGWTGRYRKAQTDEVEAMDSVAAWLAANFAPDSGAALIHNDYKYDNVVLSPEKPTEIIGVLDWEMATVGDPLMDLGTSLGYWIQADDPESLKLLPVGPTHLPGNMTRREVVAHYEEASGRTVEHPVFYYAYALFKIAVIVQQIYARFVKGLTQDPRFAAMGPAVKMLSEQAARAIDAGRIDSF